MTMTTICYLVFREPTDDGGMLPGVFSSESAARLWCSEYQRIHPKHLLRIIPLRFDPLAYNPTSPIVDNLGA